ncbi:MAG: 4-hydroxy-tetrahydrodipicolinate reductase [Actinomycetota bacterium]|jgi:4-hydroxy-tetrahydrodipicolinate reductase|nr:4-hydroxy-tetrahydrodipicolinate reductase [Actinomycetota bacterium]
MSAKPIRVGVFGAAGRMGRTVCQAVVDDPELDLVAAVDPLHAGLDLRPVTGVDADLPIVPAPEALDDLDVDVVVDFTAAAAARENLRWCAGAQVHAVVGTTGLDDGDLDELRGAFTSSNCLVAPNFAIGAVVMMRLAELAAPWFSSMEVIELHHDAKVDAPSGTSLLLTRRLAAAAGEREADATTIRVLEGARGAEGPGGIPIHSVRLRGLVAHHEVLLGTTGQSLTIRHDSYDRSSFMPGVLLAVKGIADRPGLTVGLDALLGL